MNVVSVPLVLLVIACGSGGGASLGSVPARGAVPVTGARFETRMREAVTPLERRLVADGHALDPGLDCVAQAVLGGAKTRESGAARYRHELPLRCGSPLFVLAAREIGSDDDAIAAIAAIDRAAPSPLRFAVGIAEADGRRVIAFARNSLQLDEVARDGGRMTIRGQGHVDAERALAVVATESRVTHHPFSLQDGAFSVTFDAPPHALVELVVEVAGHRGPFGRVQLGDGVRQMRARGTERERLAAIRHAARVPELALVDQGATTCNPIAPVIGGIEVTDLARCIELPLIERADLASELAWRAEHRATLIDPRVAVLEVGARARGGLRVRLLRSFEVLSPADGSARVLAMLRERWPRIAVRPVAAGQLAALVSDWARERDPFTAAAAHKPALDQLAARWTTTKTFYTVLTAGRELSVALDLVRPDVTPTSVDVAFLQAQRPTGELVHLVAIVLELP